MVMCLDNVIAVAATAQGNFTLLMLGLAISIPLVVFGSTLMIRLMERWPAIVTLGAALIGWVAGETIANDHVLADFATPLGPLRRRRRGAALVRWWAQPCSAARPPPPAPASAEPDRSSGNRFSTLLGGHLDALHAHALVHRLAHVVHGQQGHLHRRQGFHFHAGLAMGLHRGRALHCVFGIQQLEIHGHPGQAGDGTGESGRWFLGGHDAGNAGDAQHIAFLGRAAGDDGQRGRRHHDAAFGHGDAVGVGLAPTSTMWACPCASKWVSWSAIEIP
jgi:hypothetical protein